MSGTSRTILMASSGSVMYIARPAFAMLGSLALVSWLPADGVGQFFLLALWLMILIAGLSTRVISFTGTPLFILACTALIGAVGLLFEGSDALVLNAVLAAFTLSPLLLLPLRLHLTDDDYNGLITLTAWLSVAQFFIALSQFIAANGALVFVSMAAGDHAVGTLLSHSHLFVVKMLVASIILSTAFLAGVQRRLSGVGAVFALLGALLGSALLATLLVAGALVLVAVLLPTNLFGAMVRAGMKRFRGLIISGLVVGAGVMWLTQADNVAYIVRTARTFGESVIGSIVDDTGPGKLRSTGRTLELLVKNPKLFLVGTGPGAYSSRAALILSGEYLYNQPSTLPVSTSSYTEELITPLWNRSIWTVQYQDGVMNQPYYGIQTFIGEGGMLTLALVAALYIWFWVKIVAIRPHSKPKLAAQLAGILMLSVLPFMLLTDNWLEFPHAAIALLLPIVVAINLPLQRKNCATLDGSVGKHE